MSKDDRKSQPAVGEGSGAQGGKAALKADQQEPMGVDPDSAVDEKARESRHPEPGGLEQNLTVRNA